VVNVDNNEAEEKVLDELYHSLIFVISVVVTAEPVVVKSTWFKVVLVSLTANVNLCKILFEEFITIFAADGWEPLSASVTPGQVPVIVPLTAMFLVVAPVDVNEIFPLYDEPALPEAILTYIV
jgi:glucose-6-phosphate-specific signal transduction histidine kinase